VEDRGEDEAVNYQHARPTALKPKKWAGGEHGMIKAQVLVEELP